jgi:hypothetical protein
MLCTPVCPYPIIVTHLSFNFLCLLLLYSIYLNCCYPVCWRRKMDAVASPDGGPIRHFFDVPAESKQLAKVEYFAFPVHFMAEAPSTNLSSAPT